MKPATGGNVFFDFFLAKNGEKHQNICSKLRPLRFFENENWFLKIKFLKLYLVGRNVSLFENHKKVLNHSTLPRPHCRTSCFVSVFLKQTFEFNRLFQKDQGKTAIAVRILSPNPTWRPLPCLLIQSFFYDCHTVYKENLEKWLCENQMTNLFGKFVNVAPSPCFYSVRIFS